MTCGCKTGSNDSAFGYGMGVRNDVLFPFSTGGVETIPIDTMIVKTALVPAGNYDIAFKIFGINCQPEQGSFPISVRIGGQIITSLAVTPSNLDYNFTIRRCLMDGDKVEIVVTTRIQRTVGMVSGDTTLAGFVLFRGVA